MRSKLGHAETKSAHSLKFHLGVLGLLLQRLPAPSLHHEVEEYNYECWLTYQLICSSPVDTDLSFLTHLGQQVMNAATPRPIPPSSLSRVIFHHLFKGAPAALSKCLTERQRSCWRKPWVAFFNRMECLVPNPLRTCHLTATSLSVLSRLRDMEFIAAKCRVAYCLARSLSEKQGNSIKIMEYKTETGNRVPRRESFEMEMPRKIMKSGVDKALKWLTDFVVSSGLETVKCLVSCKGDVNTFLAQSELLDLCEKVLRKEEDVFTSHGRNIVQGILLSLFAKGQSIGSFRRHEEDCIVLQREAMCNKSGSTTVDLQRTAIVSRTVNAFLPFEVLMDASHGMLEHYKEKLVTTENANVNQVLWSQKGALCLGRLFNEGYS
ncbi:hypothetical protein OS493_032167 [Desmophyllum pertusum]|uniref:Uncharacterized protein n=1 Tax=Desmophyllum pertusum TaxID=174260 RepID=A0A9W9ZWS7_9CNID|nr:hypothetical protein OS493_032167 [Desmophyllum pertusum]